MVPRKMIITEETEGTVMDKWPSLHWIPSHRTVYCNEVIYCTIYFKVHIYTKKASAKCFNMKPM